MENMTKHADEGSQRPAYYEWLNRPSTYHDWLNQLVQNPGSQGIRGIAFVAAMVPLMFALAFVGTFIFPAGRYPRILLALPGLVAGGIVSYVLGGVCYLLPKLVSVALCSAISIAGSIFIYYGLKTIIAG